MRLMGGSKNKSNSNMPHANPVNPMPPEQYVKEAQEHGTSKGEDIKEESPEFEEIHTANKWENVELGDEGRKNKFLRLMGAARAKDSLKETPEQAPKERTTYDAEKMEQDLAKQYEQGLEFRRTGGVRSHRGLGFSEEIPPPAPTDNKPDFAGPTEMERREGQPQSDAPLHPSSVGVREDRHRVGSRFDREREPHRSHPYERRAPDDRREGSQHDRDLQHRSERDQGRKDGRYTRGDESRHNRPPDRYGKPEEKADPSEYGYVRDDSHKNPFSQGYGFQNETGDSASQQQSGGYSLPGRYEPQSGNASGGPAQGGGRHWSTQPPPPPPPEPSPVGGHTVGPHTAHNRPPPPSSGQYSGGGAYGGYGQHYGGNQGKQYGDQGQQYGNQGQQYGNHGQHGNQGQPYGSPRPPPQNNQHYGHTASGESARKRFQKPMMNFVKSSDS